MVRCVWSCETLVQCDARCKILVQCVERCKSLVQCIVSCETVLQSVKLRTAVLSLVKSRLRCETLVLFLMHSLVWYSGAMRCKVWNSNMKLSYASVQLICSCARCRTLLWSDELSSVKLVQFLIPWCKVLNSGVVYLRCESLEGWYAVVLSLLKSRIRCETLVQFWCKV